MDLGRSLPLQQLGSMQEASRFSSMLGGSRVLLSLLLRMVMRIYLPSRSSSHSRCCPLPLCSSPLLPNSSRSSSILRLPLPAKTRHFSCQLTILWSMAMLFWISSSSVPWQRFNLSRLAGRVFLSWRKWASCRYWGMLECSRKVLISFRCSGKLLQSVTMGIRLAERCASRLSSKVGRWAAAVSRSWLWRMVMDSKLPLSSSSSVKVRQRLISESCRPMRYLRQSRVRRRDIWLREVQLGSMSWHFTSCWRLYCSATCSTKRRISSKLRSLMAEIMILSKQSTRTLFLPIMIAQRFSSLSSPLLRGVHYSRRQMANTGLTQSSKQTCFFKASSSVSPLEVTTSTIWTYLWPSRVGFSTQLMGLFSSVWLRSTSNSSTISSSALQLLQTILQPCSSSQTQLFLLLRSVSSMLPTRLRFFRLLRSSCADEPVSLRMMVGGYSGGGLSGDLMGEVISRSVSFLGGCMAVTGLEERAMRCSLGSGWADSSSGDYPKQQQQIMSYKKKYGIQLVGCESGEKLCWWQANQVGVGRICYRHQCLDVLVSSDSRLLSGCYWFRRISYIFFSLLRISSGSTSLCGRGSPLRVGSTSSSISLSSTLPPPTGSGELFSSFFSLIISDTNSQVTMPKTRASPAIWAKLVSWWQQKMERPTVKILRVVMTKGGKCCLNCLIMRQTNIWPKVDRTPIVDMWMANKRCSQMNSSMSLSYMRQREQIMATIATHLFMAVIISMGWGLQTDLISA